MNRLDTTAEDYATEIGLPVDVVREMLAGDMQRQRRARDCMSALGSVRAEGLDPSGVIGGLHAWVLGEVTLDTVIRRELDDVAETYGPPSDSRET